MTKIMYDKEWNINSALPIHNKYKTKGGITKLKEPKKAVKRCG